VANEKETQSPKKGKGYCILQNIEDQATISGKSMS
jgi:hypothetical protein